MANDRQSQTTPTSDEQLVENNWQAVMEQDDEDAFRAVVHPHTQALMDVARADLRFYVEQGELHERDFTPEEITGETLIYAWQHRRQRPEQMSLRGWLLGMQYRVMRAMVEKLRAYRHDKAISLDEPIPPHAADFETEEWFYEWNQPQSGDLTWEDITPGLEPVDLEVPLDGNRNLFTLDPDDYHVLMLHDEFEMPLSEVAFTLSRSLNETAEMLDQARVTLRERLAEADPDGRTDTYTNHPAPPDGSNI